MTHRLVAYQNFLRTDKPSELIRRIRKCSRAELWELAEQLDFLDDNWAPDIRNEPVAAYYNAAKTFSADGWRQTRRGRMNIDTQYATKLLVYYPHVQVILPFARVDETPSLLKDNPPDLEFDLQTLLHLKPLLDHNLISIVPSSAAERYAEGYAYNRDQSRDQTDIDRETPELVAILDEFDPFVGYDDEDEFWSSKLRWERKHNYTAHKYGIPSYDMNVDLALTSATGSELVCVNESMQKYLTKKYEMTSRKMSVDSFWGGLVCRQDILDSTNISPNDLIQIRLNDDGFAQWRSDVSRSLRQIRTEADQGFLREDEIKTIVADEIRASAAQLKAHIKKSSVLSIAYDSVVPFCISAAASFIVNPSPSIAVGTGAVSSAITTSYKILSSRGARSHQSLLKIYTSFLK